ncbi:DUF1993 family protein [Pseudogemmobacter bohemicus]|uniref:DUF1993 family protein n=1 Tax=Pseudogemmobacter bohemicus TaxID=2250708 RepID=UPI00130063E2|nr:DUF1993 family protein [Pseudogemmobacter bohemicus]
MYQATVPVFRHTLSRIADMVALAGPDALDQPFQDMTARQRFSIAAGLSIEITCPLAGRELPDLPAALGPRLAVARALLGGMKPAEFDPDPGRMIRREIDNIPVALPAVEFLHLFGMPLFFFQTALGYAGLRAAGVALSETDFDGFARPPARPPI